MAQTPEQKAAAKAARDAKKAAAAAAPAAETGVTPESEVAVPVEPEAPAKASKSGPITIKYRDHRGEPTERTFSKEVHGDDFAKLADEFKATNASRLIE